MPHRLAALRLNLPNEVPKLQANTGPIAKVLSHALERPLVLPEHPKNRLVVLAALVGAEVDAL